MKNTQMRTAALRAQRQRANTWSPLAARTPHATGDSGDSLGVTMAVTSWMMTSAYGDSSSDSGNSTGSSSDSGGGGGE